MTTYNTGNDLGSVDARDLYDNAENLDVAVNSPAHGWTDRLGVERKSYAGMEDDFQQFLLASGYEDLGEYEADIVITARNQIFTHEGEYYRAAAATVLPYTTTGSWSEDYADFVAIGDAALRQDLALHADTTIGFFHGAINCAQFGGLAAAVADADTAGKIIMASDAQAIASSLTINNRAIMAQFGAVITIASGQTLTINGPANLAAGSITGAGSLVLGPGSVKGIDPDWFAGTDNVKVQAAIDTAEGSTWTPLVIHRKYTLTAPVTIDRAVDVSTNDFRIIGTGPDAGFYTAAAINMFSSTIAHTDDPVSEHISFECIHFSASSSALDCFVIDGDKFLRMKFLNCMFLGVRLAYTENYYQSIRIAHSYLIGWAGDFMAAANGGGGTYEGRIIDCHFDNFSAEFGAPGGSRIFVAASPVSGCSITNCLMENFDGPAIQVGAFAGSLISGNYFEAITESAIKLGGTNSVTISGNLFVSSNPAWYAIDCETSFNISSGGNYSSSHLFNDDNMRAGYDGLVSLGDIAGGNLYKDISKNQFVAIGTLTGFAGVDPAGYYYVSRCGSTISIAFPTVSGTSDATTMTLVDAIPAKWLPVTARQSIVHVIDNGVTAPGLITISSAGISFTKDTAGNLFTASGTKGIIASTITYNMYP